MIFEIKNSIKPVKYEKAISILEKKFEEIYKGSNKEFLWFLEHQDVFTGGASHSKQDILDKKIKLIETKRGGKITWHGRGQIICYMVIDLRKRKKDVRNFIIKIEKSIIDTIDTYKIKAFNDRKQVGIWVNKNNSILKIGAIGFRIKKWIAYHGFSLNVNNNLSSYKKIIPCGIKNRGVTNLINIKKQNYKNLKKILQEKLVKNLSS